MLQSAFGLAALMGLAWLISENKRAVGLKSLLACLAMQFFLGFLFLKVPVCRTLFLHLNDAVAALQSATRAGTEFVFGFLGGGQLPYKEEAPGLSWTMAFRALPLMLVISALSSLLFYWRILPLVVRAFSWLLKKTLDIGGALGVSVAANVFIGMVEAPLLVRPYLAEMTRSELFTLMTCGMATIAGTVLVVYASIMGPVLEGALGHILVASIISAPAGILVSRIMVPETEPHTAGEAVPPEEAHGTMDAIGKGTLQGVSLVLNVTAMLIVLVALVALANKFLGLLPDAFGAPITLERTLGWIMSPIVWLIGIPWSEAPTAGMLMGVKTVLNEFIAYVQLSKLPADALSPKSRVVMTYAMCGFANFGSLGIMIGGLAAMAPSRTREIATLAPKSLISGTLATLMTGAVVSILW